MRVLDFCTHLIRGMAGEGFGRRVWPSFGPSFGTSFGRPLTAPLVGPLAGALMALVLLFGAVSEARAFEAEARAFYPAQGTAVTEISIISTADIDAFEPLLLAWQRENPGVAVRYVIASSSELMKAVYDEGVPFDLAISSAVDLQTKIANDGLALSHSSAATEDLPVWAKWRNQVFAFTQEPAVLVVSDAYFGPDAPPPTSREDLIALLRDQPERFRGRVGTYDVRRSGAGYLFATQDSRNSDNYWRLTEVMGRLDARLYCCSGDMIEAVANGELALAYNVLGSYAESRLPVTPGIRIVAFNDYLTVMLRSALIPANAQNPGPARSMIDFLAQLKTRPELNAASGLPPIDAARLRENNALRPIRPGPALLVFLDRLKKETFLRSWTSAILQP